MSDCRPIGVFGSGVGGLTIAAKIRARLPAESLLYFADTAWAPYGGRPLEVIRDRALAVGEYLAGAGVKALVVACNTACGAALEALRSTLALPVVGVEPAVKPAVSASRNGRIGVMATEAMPRSSRFSRLLEVHAPRAQIVAQPCPGLVELIEGGCIIGPAVRQQLQSLLEPLRRAAVDTVVLGCTHYPLLTSAVREVLGPEIMLLDSGAAVARQTERVLAERGSLCTAGRASLRPAVSGDPDRFAATVNKLWGEPLQVGSAAV